MVEHLVEGLVGWMRQFIKRPVLVRFDRRYRKNPGGFSQSAAGQVYRVANVCRMVGDGLHLVVVRWVGPQWRVTYVGKGLSREILRSELFPSAPLRQVFSRVHPWQTSAVLQAALRQGDLVVAALNQVLRTKPPEGFRSFASPQWITQVVERLDRPVEEILLDVKPHLRTRIRRLAEQGYSSFRAHTKEEFDLFYHRMYVPYARSRFAGRGLNILDYRTAFRAFRSGGLLLVRKGSSLVSGSLWTVRGDTCEGLSPVEGDEPELTAPPQLTGFAPAS